MPSDRDNRRMDLVGEGPAQGAPHAEALATIVNRSRCILWTADVEGRGDWRSGIDPRRSTLIWKPRVVNEQAAQEVVPLAVRPGSNYFEAWRESRHRSDHHRMWDTALAALASGSPSFHQVFRCFDRFGAEHWIFEDASISVRGEGLWYVVGVATDVTPHLESNETLRRVTEQLEQAVQDGRESASVLNVFFEGVPLGLALLSPDGRFLRANHAFCRMNCLSESTLRNQPITRWIDPALSSLLRRQLEQVKHTGRPTEPEQLRINGAGGHRTWELTLSPIGLDHHPTLAVSLVLQDLTQWQQTQELRMAKEVAEAANAAKDRFLAMLSHDLRMPLTPILALTSLFEGDPALDQEHRENLRIIHRNIELEARLIDDLLDTTRIARGKMVLSPQPVDMHQILSQTLEICGGQFRDKGITCDSELQAEHTTIHADPARVRQIVMNLLSNALKYTPSGGRVVLRTRNLAAPSGQEILVQVQDNGIGISPESLPRIFEPFEQAHELHDRHRQGGLGLGLAITRSLVEAHGGSIAAESAGHNKGAVFTVTIPTMAQHAPLTGSSPRALAAAATGTILLVEDHADTALVLRQLLTRCGHRVLAAGSVAEALQALAEHPVDLLISDVGLPDGSGRQIMQQCGVPLRGIALSGFGTDDDVRQSREAGFAEHLTKPVSLDRLKEAIARCLAAPPAAAAPAADAGAPACHCAGAVVDSAA